MIASPIWVAEDALVGDSAVLAVDAHDALSTVRPVMHPTPQSAAQPATHARAQGHVLDDASASGTRKERDGRGHSDSVGSQREGWTRDSPTVPVTDASVASSGVGGVFDGESLPFSASLRQSDSTASAGGDMDSTVDDGVDATADAVVDNAPRGGGRAPHSSPSVRAAHASDAAAAAADGGDDEQPRNVATERSTSSLSSANTAAAVAAAASAVTASVARDAIADRATERRRQAAVRDSGLLSSSESDDGVDAGQVVSSAVVSAVPFSHMASMNPLALSGVSSLSTSRPASTVSTSRPLTALEVRRLSLTLSQTSQTLPPPEVEVEQEDSFGMEALMGRRAKEVLDEAEGDEVYDSDMERARQRQLRKKLAARGRLAAQEQQSKLRTAVREKYHASRHRPADSDGGGTLWRSKPGEL
jgi:hypothetical protein